MYNYNTSSAYKIDHSYIDEKIKREREEELRAQKQKMLDEQAQRRMHISRAKALAVIVLLFTMAFIIVNRYVQINEAKGEVSKLQSQYNDIVASNQNLQAKIDQAVDLKKLQTVAAEKFGMVRPERYQMFYIDMQQGDFSENVAQDKAGDDKEKVAVMGVPGTLISSMKLFK